MRINKLNIILVLLLLVCLSISAVSASENSDLTNSSDDTNLEISDYSQEVLSSSNEESVTAASHTVTKYNYNQYFDNKGNLISTSVNPGDTINIDGSFSGVDFTFNKQINVVGTSTNSLDNCLFTFTGDASGSSISNLKITNTQIQNMEFSLTAPVIV